MRCRKGRVSTVSAEVNVLRADGVVGLFNMPVSPVCKHERHLSDVTRAFIQIFFFNVYLDLF